MVTLQVDGCEYKSLYKQYMWRHHEAQHTSRRFVCEYCGKALRSKVALTLHVRIHLGVKPHVCQICGHAFRQSSVLKVCCDGNVKYNLFQCIGGEILLFLSMIVSSWARNVREANQPKRNTLLSLLTSVKGSYLFKVRTEGHKRIVHNVMYIFLRLSQGVSVNWGRLCNLC